MKTKNFTKQMVEASVMIALATVLSLFKVVEMPYGGSVTLASMLPILIVSYRHGVGIGLLSGVVYSVIQQLLGLNNLSYFTTWQSVIAVMLLDYILAFTVVGIGGIFRNRIGLKKLLPPTKQKIEIATGMGLVCILRFLSHTIGGATVWAGLSIPTEAALIYSIGYNATYMIPETIISVLIGLWIGEVIDFSKHIPTRFAPSCGVCNAKSDVACEVLPHIASFLLLLAACVDTIIIAPHLQNADSGEFTFANLGEVSWVAVIIVSCVCFIGAAALCITGAVIKNRISNTK